jgi:general secretion pathway protein A
MYTAFYGLEERPFALSPDPKYLFLSETHREVLGHLIYGIEQGEGFIAISGEVGTGKTTLCRTLLERLGAESEVAFLFNPHLSPRELLLAIHTEFGLTGSGETLPELTEELNAFLLRKKADGRRVLIIIDEAQILSTETLEQVRLLSNLETSRSKLLQIVLLGQPELDQKLATRELRQLRQRISVWWHLGPMDAGETREYVRHRMRIAGADARVPFTDRALQRIHRISGGVPRIINVLCDRALLAGYGDDRKQIDPRTIDRVARELGPATTGPTIKPRSRRTLRASAAALTLVAAFGAGALLGLNPERLGISLPSPPSSAVGLQREAPPTPTLPDVAAAPPALPADAAAEAPPTFPPPDVLDTLLPLRDATTTNASMVEAALAAFGEEARRVAPLDIAEAIALLSEYGLRSIWVEGYDFEQIARIDRPTVVRLGADAAARWTLLRAIDDEVADLQGLIPGETVRVARAEFDARWTGEGYALWREHEPLPALLSHGADGAAVRWLQSALARLGQVEVPQHGFFDERTEAAVRAFQRRADLPVDGSVGPLTKLRLYEALDEYPTPLLSAKAADAAEAF